MSEKMTDGELAEHLKKLSGFSTRRVERLRTHIAALTAERDELHERVEGLAATLKASLANTEEANEASERLADGLAAAADDAKACREENDALRRTIQELHFVLGTNDGTPHGPWLVEAARELRNKAEESDALRKRAERAEADNAAKDRALSDYVEQYGAEHLEGCPEDDTCECPLVVALNDAFGLNHPGAALMSELSKLRGQFRAVAGAVGLEDGDTLKDAVERVVARAERAEARARALRDAIVQYRWTRGEDYCQCHGSASKPCRACALAQALDEDPVESAPGT